VIDPAMGSGAFLVAAVHFLAEAYGQARIAEGLDADHLIDDEERAAYRRVVVERCIYGVDKNPMAVELAKVSLWLATASADRPLSFLDAKLRCGDSLVGAFLDDLDRLPRCWFADARAPTRPSSASRSRAPAPTWPAWPRVAASLRWPPPTSPSRFGIRAPAFAAIWTPRAFTVCGSAPTCGSRPSLAQARSTPHRP
jgi:hypothetical protein